MIYLTKQLTEDIIRGGLIITPRICGKTTAIIEAMHRDERLILVPINRSARRQLQERFPSFRNRIINPNMNECSGHKDNLLILDEAFYNPLFGVNSWHAAISSYPINVKLYDESGNSLFLKGDMIQKEIKVPKRKNKFETILENE